MDIIKYDEKYNIKELKKRNELSKLLHENMVTNGAIIQEMGKNIIENNGAIDIDLIEIVLQTYASINETILAFDLEVDMEEFEYDNCWK